MSTRTSESNGLVPAGVREFIPVEATVQMDDIVSVRVASVELALSTLFEKNKLDLEAAKKLLGDANKERCRLQKRDAKSLVPASVTELRKALKISACPAKITVGEAVTICLNGKGSLQISLCNESNNYGAITWAVEVELTPELKAAHKECEAYQKDCDRLSNEMNRLVQARGKLGSVERSARAAVATQRLSQTGQGKKLLSGLSASDPSTMLGLPAGTIKV